MEDWKTRLVEEYRQLKERAEKLEKHLCKLEVERHLEVYESMVEKETEADKAERRRRVARQDFMFNQHRTMREYMHFLELRAELEGIEL